MLSRNCLYAFAALTVLTLTACNAGESSSQVPAAGSNNVQSIGKSLADARVPESMRAFPAESPIPVRHNGGVKSVADAAAFSRLLPASMRAFPAMSPVAVRRANSVGSAVPVKSPGRIAPESMRAFPAYSPVPLHR